MARASAFVRAFIIALAAMITNLPVVAKNIFSALGLLLFFRLIHDIHGEDEAAYSADNQREDDRNDTEDERCHVILLRSV